MKHLLLAVIVSSISLPAQLADALCAMPVQHPDVLNDGAAVPKDGGIVVGTRIDHGGPDEGDANQPTWKFRDGGNADKTPPDINPKLTTLAPGLILYSLPAGLTSATLGDGSKVRGRVTLSTAPAALLPAPKAKRIEHHTFKIRWGNGSSTTVFLDGDVPQGAIALVVVDAKGKPRSYARVNAGATEVQVYYQGRCSALPNGTVETRAGEKVTLRWVDQYGRVSPDSKPIAVVKKR